LDGFHFPGIAPGRFKGFSDGWILMFFGFGLRFALGLQDLGSMVFLSDRIRFWILRDVWIFRVFGDLDIVSFLKDLLDWLLDFQWFGSFRLFRDVWIGWFLLDSDFSVFIGSDRVVVVC